MHRAAASSALAQLQERRILAQAMGEGAPDGLCAGDDVFFDVAHTEPSDCLAAELQCALAHVVAVQVEFHGDLALVLHGSAAHGQAALGAGANHGLRLRRRVRQNRAGPHGLLDLDQLELAVEVLARLLAEVAGAAGEDHRDAVVPENARVQGGFTRRLAVDANFVHESTDPGVREQPAGRPRARVIAHEEGRVVGTEVERAELRQGPVANLRRTRQVTRVVIQLVQQQVAHGGVTIGDDKLRRARVARTRDGGVDVPGQPRARLLVVLSAGDQMVAVTDAGGAFHVG